MEQQTETVEQQQPVVEDVVFKAFQGAAEAFVAKVENYAGSKLQLQHVLIQLAISPFNVDPIRHGYIEEKELYELGMSVMNTKFSFMLKKLEEERAAAKEKALSQSTTDNVIPEETANVEAVANG